MGPLRRGPLHVFRASYLVRRLPAAQSSEAVAAIDRSAVTRLEWNFAILAAFGTHGTVELSALKSVPTVRFLGPACSTASETALRLICVPLGVKELLLLGGEYEFRATIRTLKGFVCETHRMTSFL